MPARAIRLYFEGVEGRVRQFYDLPGKEAPKVALFTGGGRSGRPDKENPDLKQKALSMASDSGGLRVGESVKSKTSDIDSKRMTLQIREDKGGKRRMDS
jgi:hypothetical protein